MSGENGRAITLTLAQWQDVESLVMDRITRAPLDGPGLIPDEELAGLVELLQSIADLRRVYVLNSPGPDVRCSLSVPDGVPLEIVAVG